MHEGIENEIANVNNTSTNKGHEHLDAKDRRGTSTPSQNTRKDKFEAIWDPDFALAWPDGAGLTDGEKE